MLSYVLAIITGVVTGYIYGLLFVINKQRALSSTQSQLRIFLMMGGLSFVRLSFIALFFIYLLRYEFLVSILTLASFLVTFWLSIIRKGLMHHEGRSST